MFCRSDWLLMNVNLCPITLRVSSLKGSPSTGCGPDGFEINPTPWRCEMVDLACQPTQFQPKTVILLCLHQRLSASGSGPQSETQTFLQWVANVLLEMNIVPKHPWSSFKTCLFWPLWFVTFGPFWGQTKKKIVLNKPDWVRKYQKSGLLSGLSKG